MKIATLFLILSFIFPSICFPSTEASLENFVSSWIVNVEGEPRQRILKISKINKSKEKEIVLDATYGYLDQNQVAVQASLTQENPVKLNLSTYFNNKIEATQQSADTFSGTFTLTNGTKKNVTIVRALEGDIPVKKNITIPVFEKPTPGTPTSCAAFLGVWTGNWESIGQTWLWITSVSEKCILKYAYLDNPIIPKTFQMNEADGSKFIIPLKNAFIALENQKENELIAKYSADGRGVVNITTLYKVNTLDGTLEKIQNEQRKKEAIIQPSQEIPEICAAFFGTWLGKWSNGNFEEQRLHITEVSSSCKAKLSYSATRNLSRDFEIAEIRDGVLSFVCNKSTNGTCSFSYQNGNLNASYHNPAGGTNGATFKKQVR
jgi:hypothetical protein